MKRSILLTIAMFAAFGLSGCSYNDLTAKQQTVKANWSKVESSLQRRAVYPPSPPSQESPAHVGSTLCGRSKCSTGSNHRDACRRARLAPPNVRFRSPTGWGINLSAETPAPSPHAFWQIRSCCPIADHSAALHRLKL